MELPIEKILDNYRLDTPDKAVREAAQKSLEKVVGVTLPLSAISYRSGKVRVDVSPLVRSQVHIKKEQLLAEMQEHLKSKNITDIQ